MASQNKTPTKTKNISSRKSKVTSLPLLLEIGTEEIPTKFLPQALQDLADLGTQLFRECRLNYDQIRTVGTSRRLALLVEGVQSRQSSLTQEVVGPPKAAGFDASGAPTKAAQGFAKSQGVLVEQLTIKETPKGLYLAVERREKGESAKKVLMASLPGLLAKLNFPKAMRWNASQIKFARPIRWLVALLGVHTIKMEFAGLTSDEMTQGHRFCQIKGKKKGQPVRLTNAASYVATMKKHGVLVDPNERWVIIEQQMQDLTKSAKGKVDPVHRAELIEEAVYGVEYPHAIIGKFSNEFLALPKPVLISSMKEHQGFLSVLGKDGELLPKFIAVTNTPWGNTKLMTKGNERVLAARLKDAQHFFQEDKKQTLHDRVPALDGVIFHHKLGTMRQKVERVQDLAEWMAGQLGRDDLKSACQRAGLLSKADLTTGMVGEFPNLQGVMGEEYARHDGEPEEICKAIGEHYLPRFPDDQLPVSLPGNLVACADRCDSIVSFFAAGMAPSGSEDPLGLRRAAYGVVRIITENSLELNIVASVKKALDILDGQGRSVRGKTQNPLDVVAFILDRLRFYGRNTMGLPEDVMEAVTRVRPEHTADVGDLLLRMRALQGILSHQDFETLMLGFKRAHRIVEKEAWRQTAVIPEHLQHESEKRLSRVLTKAQQEVTDCVTVKDYAGALQNLLPFKAPIDDFFAAVLVNDSDPHIRENRLSLLTAIDHLFLTIADFSCIQSVGVDVARG